MVCKPVAGVFGVSGGKNSTEKGIMPVLQGPMGPPGPPGRTGLQGPKGLPDYRKVETLVSNYLQPLKCELANRFSRKQSQNAFVVFFSTDVSTRKAH